MATPVIQVHTFSNERFGTSRTRKSVKIYSKSNVSIMGDEGRHHQEFRARRVDGTSVDGTSPSFASPMVSNSFFFVPGLEDAASQSRLTYDRMSAEESRLFPEICKGDIKRHKTFLVIRNNIVSTASFASPIEHRRSSFGCGSTNPAFN